MLDDQQTVLVDTGMAGVGSQQDPTGACAAQQQCGATPFSTTHTFTTTHGFVIASPAAAGAGQQQQQQQVAGRPPQLQPPQPPAAAPAGPSSSNGGSASTPVGWSGLLEISRSGGCPPGLVGSAAGGWEEELGSRGHIEVACTAHASTGVRRLVKAVIRGLKARQEPEGAREGMGGTYFFSNEAGRKVAIFKPCDEEPLAPANPKGYVGRALGDPGWKSTVRVGEAAMREVAAYLLDHEHFARVPATVLVQAQHAVFNYRYHAATSTAAAPAGAGAASAAAGSSGTASCASAMSTGSPPDGAAAAAAAAAVADADAAAGVAADGGARSGSSGRPLKLGSLQEFVYHVSDTSELGASRFAARDVHAIGILDLRLFNTDRHAGNILVRAPPAGDAAGSPGCRTLGLPRPPAGAAGSSYYGQYELIPIDHGFALPEALDAPYFEWLHWPQACLPFDAEELAYIARLDPARDIALLQQELPNLRPECLRVLEVSTTLLQRCAAAGLTLADIGAIASRPLDALDGDDTRPSDLEVACIAARQAVETRELAATLSSSFSSDDAFTLREEAEEDLMTTSSELEEEAGSDADAAACQQQQPSRLGVTPMVLATDSGAAAAVDAAADAAGGSEAGGGALAAGQQEPGAGTPLGCGSKAGSGDLASTMSEGTTVCGLATAMSLGSRAHGGAADVDLLFDLDDESGSSAANTPLASSSGGAAAARAASPLGRRALAGAGAAGGAAAGGVTGAAAGGGAAADVDMAPAGSSLGGMSSMQTEALSQFLASVQLVPGGAAAATSSDAAAGGSVSSAGAGSSFALASPHAGGAAAAAAAPSTPGGASGHGSYSVARSVQPGGGLPGTSLALRDLRAKGGFGGMLMGHCGAAAGLKKGSVAAAARRRTGVTRAMYPPPVVRAAPRAANEVLSGLSDAQWAAFMEELRAHMDAALRPGSGAWRRASQAAGLGAAAMSCPRF